jgi:hypothetical protein
MSQSASQSEQRDCLIAVINNDTDMQRFRDERWYRIPARAIGRSLRKESLDESRILALYQTSTVQSGLPGTIELWGEIEEVQQLSRRQIVPDEPHHPSADEQYYLIRLRNIERLEQPVASRRPRRITFIRTSGERLFRASDINDLIIGSVIEEQVWNAIREFDVERKYFMRAQGMVMEVDFAIFTSGGALGVICGDDGYDSSATTEGWSVLRFSPGRLETEFADCMEELMTTLHQMRMSMPHNVLSEGETSG